MFAKVEFIIETPDCGPDFGEGEFKREIEALISDIDPIGTRLVTFNMDECDDPIVNN